MRPLPHPDAVTRPYWEGCARGLLRYQRCRDCGTVQLMPRSLCAHCHGKALEWRDASGLGRVLSFTEVHRAPLPAFRAETPYVIAIADMDEGFRLMANVDRGAASGVGIGTRVRVAFREVEGIALPLLEVCP